jgi:asparagine synthase (glutamine-hydrolysing)
VSAVACIFGGDGPHVDGGVARSMARAMEARGAEHVGVWSRDAATLAVARSGWELEPAFSGPSLVVEVDDVVVAADASLFYHADLLRALAARGVVPEGATPAHLILAAYRAWGTACTDHLEGDWAFVLWDRARDRVLCARDFGGKRPLFYAEPDGLLLVASGARALLRHPRCPSGLNPVAIAADSAGFFAAPHETAFRAVFLLPAGWSLVKKGGAPARLLRHWAPPPMNADGDLRFEEAAEQLRALLRHAVEERLDGTDPTSVWLSGGWDSTAVFGAGEAVLRDQGAGHHLHAVSLSFPRDDPGREDELIEAVAGHWGSPVHWLDIRDVPVLDKPLQRAAARDEPFAHAFEMGNRALAAGSRQVGARVAFDGSGGDQLFQVTAVYLADLFRTLRWPQLAREWRRRGMSGSGARGFFQWAVLPNLPPFLRAAAGVVRGGRTLRPYLERPLPVWIDSRFVRTHRLLERERRHAPSRVGGSLADHETHWYITHPYFPRAFAAVAGFALESGVELRSPLYDRRIVEFALTRPREERASGAETKRLLRHAMRGLLPYHVLAPRRFRTGTSGGYLQRSLQQLHAPLIGEILAQPLALADLGIVNATALREHWAVYLRQGGGELGVNLFLTLQTELWLRTYR